MGDPIDKASVWNPVRPVQTLRYIFSPWSMSHVRAFRTNGYPLYTGFPKKDARFSKLKNISGLLSDNKKGKIMEFQL